MVHKMTIHKHHIPTKKEYKDIHNKIRRKLEKAAFDKVYRCFRCGAKGNLEIHIPNCNPQLIDQPGFYQLLCQKCHNEETYSNH